jgi:hypothetical protein
VFGNAVEFVARAFDVSQRLLPLFVVHLRRGIGEPPRGAPQNRDRRVEFPLERGCLRFGGRR